MQSYVGLGIRTSPNENPSHRHLRTPRSYSRYAVWNEKRRRAAETEVGRRVLTRPNTRIYALAPRSMYK